MLQIRRCLAACLAVLMLPLGLRAQPLPTDSRLVMGELDNGLRYIVRQHNNPPGRAAFWLHVSSGSLNETDKQRGIAHFLEHMAFNGSEHFPPGSVVPLFESLGLTFGHDQNAFTSFDQTVYQLSLPDTKPETLDKSLTFLADVDGRLLLQPKEIDSERQVIQEERRSRLGSLQRVQDYYFEHLAPGSIFGQRIPIGTEEAINTFAPQDFRDYYSRWYTPADMTLLAVADMDPKVVVEQIKAHFSGGAKAAKPKDQDVGLKPFDKNRAIVATDPELTAAEIGFNWLLAPAAPVTSIETLRARYVEEIGTWILNRRLGQRIAEGKAPFQSASSDVSDLFGAGRLAAIIAHGETGKWKEMLTELAVETQRARLHGFTEQELADAKKELRSGAERAVETDATRPASSILRELNSAVENGDALTSAQQDLEAATTVLNAITLEEVASRFKSLFDTSAPLTFVLQAPSKGEVPTEDQLVELGVKALAVQPPAEAERKRATALMDKAPEPAAIGNLAEDPATHVWTGTLANGPLVHYRFMDYRKDQATIVITLAGGEIQETAENRGITQAGAVAWIRPATSKLSSTDIRDLMTGTKVRVGPQVSGDAAGLAISGSPAELETGLQLAYLLMTDPVVEPAAFEQWKTAQKQAIGQRKTAPIGVIAELIAKTFYPPDARLSPLESEQVDRREAAAAQAWLRDLCAKAPIELAVVGDIDKDRALDLVRRYIGTLPKRDTISHDTLKSLRAVKHKDGPLEGSRDVLTQTDQAVAVAGFFGPAFENIEDVRLLNLVTQILTTRATAEIREKQQLAYSPSVNSSPGIVYPDLGMVIGASTTAPAKANDLLNAFEALYAAFATEGPTADEVTTAKKQIAAQLEEQMRDPGFWTSTLSSMDYRGRTLASIVGAPAAYQAFTAEQLKGAWVKYDRPERTFRLKIMPVKPIDAPELPSIPGAPKPSSDK